MSTALATQPTMAIQAMPPLAAFAMSPQDLVNQITLIQQAMQMVMKDGVHYGTIPGTEKKDRDGNLLKDQPKALYQAGAETLSVMYGLTAKVDLITKDLLGSHREVTALVTLFDRAGNMRSQATGFATTMESKHRYRGAAGKDCPSCGEKTVKRGSAKYGGGYYCDQNKGGCGLKWTSSTPEAKELDKQPTLRAENQDCADVYNTVIKMAEKRAFVAAVRRATGCSDIFGHDLEDLEHRMQEIKDAEGVEVHPSEGSVGKTDKKEDKKVEETKAETKKETVKEATSPRILMNREGKALKDALDTLQKDSGTPVMVRLCKLHGADSFPILPDAKIETMRKDLAELTAKAKDMAAIEDTLAGWERTAQEGA